MRTVRPLPLVFLFLALRNFVAALRFRSYLPKTLPLQWHPARRTVLDLLGVSAAAFEIVEEDLAVLPFDLPKLSPEPIPLRAWMVQDNHWPSPPPRQHSCHLAAG